MSNRFSTEFQTKMTTLKALTAKVLVDVGRSRKPRTEGLTIVLDKGLAPEEVAHLAASGGRWWDFAKFAWASVLIADNLEDRLAAYCEADVTPLLGGTLFEYAWLHGRVGELLALAREARAHVEISDGVVPLPRLEKLRAIEHFAAHVPVFSELGSKSTPIKAHWPALVKEELDSGATRVIIEDQEIGPPGQEIRSDLIEELVGAAGPGSLIFEAIERKQQAWLVRRLGPNVNLGNILPQDLITVECLRQGLNHDTLLALDRLRKDPASGSR